MVQIPERGGGGLLPIIRDQSRERSIFFSLEEYKRVDISRVEVRKRVRNTVIRCLKVKRVKRLILLSTLEATQEKS